MEWNTETQRHRALFFERTEFTECEKWNGTQRHKDTELYFLREQSSQSKSLALWSLLSLYIYFSVPLCLCVQYKGLTDFSQSISD